MQKTTFSRVPNGMGFKFLGDVRYWFKKDDSSASTWTADGMARIWKEEIPNSEIVLYKFAEAQPHRDAS